jgi:hypothetical protein
MNARIGFAMKNIAAVLMALVIGAGLIFASKAHAYGTAVPGTVVATETVAVQRQPSYSNGWNGDSNLPPQCQQYGYGGYGNNYEGQAAGGALGAAIGYAAGRHSVNGGAIAAVGGVIGALVGNHIEQQSSQRQAYACQQIQQEQNAPRLGQRVLVRLSDGYQKGQVVSVTVSGGREYGPGERVWVVGYNHLMPAYDTASNSVNGGGQGGYGN